MSLWKVENDCISFNILKKHMYTNLQMLTSLRRNIDGTKSWFYWIRNYGEANVAEPYKIRKTIRTLSVMVTIASLVGLAGVLIINFFIS